MQFLSTLLKRWKMQLVKIVALSALWDAADVALIALIYSCVTLPKMPTSTWLSLTSLSVVLPLMRSFLLLRTPLNVKFAMVDGMAHIFMFIGKTCITVSTTFLGFLLIKPMLPEG